MLMMNFACQWRTSGGGGGRQPQTPPRRTLTPKCSPPSRFELRWAVDDTILGPSFFRVTTLPRARLNEITGRGDSYVADRHSLELACE